VRLVRALAFLSALVGLGQTAVAAPAAAPAAEAARVRHSMKVALDPVRGWLSVTDTLSLPADTPGPGRTTPLGMAEFLLHGGLKITAS
jgi:hypothetical protein